MIAPKLRICHAVVIDAAKWCRREEGLDPGNGPEPARVRTIISSVAPSHVMKSPWHEPMASMPSEMERRRITRTVHPDCRVRVRKWDAQDGHARV